MSIIPVTQPDVTIECDKKILKHGETSICTLSYRPNNKLHFETVDDWEEMYKNNFKSLEALCFSEATFLFKNDNFKVIDYESIYDVTFEDNKFDLKKNDEVTCEANKYNILLKMTVTPSSTMVAGASLAISADNLVYIDSFGVSNFDPSTTLAVEAPVEKQKEIENPKTSVTASVLFVAIFICGMTILFIVGYKKNLFKKI